MATTIELDEETSSLLEELRTEVEARAGTAVTQQEILFRLVEDAHESTPVLVDSFRGSPVPLSDEEKAAMRSGRFGSDVDTDEDDVDETLYR